MRSFILAATFSFTAIGGNVLAQASVPNTFVAGNPAKAAEVNANFQALVNAINSVSARVANLEGEITSSDLVGTYALHQFQTELGGGSSERVEVYTGGGTVTLAADGTGTISGNTELGHNLNLKTELWPQSTIPIHRRALLGVSQTAQLTCSVKRFQQSRVAGY